jgi:3-oxoacyl-[acyl-carrier protein] reductase
MGRALISRLSPEDWIIGLQYHEQRPALHEGKFPSLHLYQSDLSVLKNAGTVVEDFVRDSGGLDVLIQLSGGIHRPVDWREMTEEDFTYDLNLNLTSVFFLVQSALPYLEKSSSPRIVLMSTASAAHGGGPTSLAYGIAKAGIECLTKRLAKDCAQYGILVNAVAPGFIETRFHTVRMKKTPEELRERTSCIPLKRPGKPEDVALVIQMLIAEENNFVTGEIIDISGGDFI